MTITFNDPNSTQNKFFHSNYYIVKEVILINIFAFCCFLLSTVFKIQQKKKKKDFFLQCSTVNTTMMCKDKWNIELFTKMILIIYLYLINTSSTIEIPIFLLFLLHSVEMQNLSTFIFAILNYGLFLTGFVSSPLSSSTYLFLLTV